MRKDIEVVGNKMTKHSDECGQHLQAQNIVCCNYIYMYIVIVHIHVYVYTCIYSLYIYMYMRKTQDTLIKTKQCNKTQYKP